MTPREKFEQKEKKRIIALFGKLLPKYLEEGRSQKMARSKAINEIVSTTGYSQPTVRKYISEASCN